MNKNLSRAILLAAAIGSAAASATPVNQGFRKITQVDCDGGYCYVYFSGGALTGLNGTCSAAIRVRYTPTTDIGKTWTTTIMSAFLAGRDFQPVLDSASCADDNAVMLWYQVK